MSNPSSFQLDQWTSSQEYNKQHKDSDGFSKWLIDMCNHANETRAARIQMEGYAFETAKILMEFDVFHKPTLVAATFFYILHFTDLNEEKGNASHFAVEFGKRYGQDAVAISRECSKFAWPSMDGPHLKEYYTSCSIYAKLFYIAWMIRTVNVLAPSSAQFSTTTIQKFVENVYTTIKSVPCVHRGLEQRLLVECEKVFAFRRNYSEKEKEK